MRSTYEFTLTLDQYLRAHKEANRRALARMPWGWLVQAMGVGMVIVAAFLAALSFDYTSGRYAMIAKPVFYASLILLSLLVLYPFLYYRGQRRLMSKPNFVVGMLRTMSVDERGIAISHGHYTTRYEWGGIVSAQRQRDIVFLALDELFGLSIPVSAFVDDAECLAFIEFVRARIAACQVDVARRAWAAGSVANEPAVAQIIEGTDAPAAPSSGQPLPPAAEASSAAQLAATVRNAFRAAFFRPLPEEQLPFSWWHVLVFAGAGIAIPPLFSLAMTGLDGVIDWYSLAPAMLHVGLALVAAIAAGHLLEQPARIPRLLLAALMIGTVVDAAVFSSWAAVTLLDVRLNAAALSAYQYLPPLWWTAAFAVHAQSGTFAPPARRTASAAVLCIVLALPLATLPRDRNFWEPRPDATAAAERKPRRNPAGEDVLNAQPVLLARDLANIQPGKKGVPELFFVGMAGYADQDVFRKEIDAVDTLFQDQFGTAGHSIKLVNSRATLTDAPFASVSNLRAALRRVAQQMNGDEDALVLFLTSHGSENHEFSLAMWPLEFNKLNPQVLRGLLDESGIRHRVVVVSACYSGGFVDALRDDHTLVISASAPDRNSFGCSNEAEWTYFGKAYFDEALRATHSFTAAFEMALPVITEREKKDNFDPSLPQMALGADIAPKLQAIETALRARGAAAPDAQSLPVSASRRTAPSPANSR